MGTIELKDHARKDLSDYGVSGAYDESAEADSRQGICVAISEEKYQVIAYGISFEGKECCVKAKQL